MLIFIRTLTKMILISTLALCFILATAELNPDNQFCEISSKKTCEEESVKSDEKYILYDVNPPEGFNLRRDVYMRFAIMLAEAKKAGKRVNWKLVLPPWHKLYHWKNDYLEHPVPWSAFFDIKSLQSYAPVMELNSLFSKDREILELDRLYVLQNFENAFEGGTFVDKWKIIEDCDYDGDFWGYENITVNEIVCVQFQGQISKLWELVALHPNDKYVMFSHGEIPLHDTYGTKPYWDCRKSMKFNNQLVKAATNYIFNNLNCEQPRCDTYMSVHWRRGDFARSRPSDVPSITGAAKQISAAAKKAKLNLIFIATDASSAEMKKLEAELHDFKLHFYDSNKDVIKQLRDGGVAIIEQIICAHAAYFIGTHESTFTFRIQEEREILGFKSKTTFNRLCPDKGKCERPSKWTIIN